ncbi:DUF4397 domain-containing protein [Niastella populi]|uniref:DUF4397 domain-containing protein n=1 Tax=Niastella populi TaxID=550983 RepID=A0A1V9G4L7_9BACT|nr:DUF4397 domain-containing protein [Niastella populi]OQP65595.1 hypothetical protein A4R26_14270 [Niastella populi]
MKKYIMLTGMVIAGAATIYSCKKNTISVAPFDVASDQALFKLNYACPYRGIGAVQIKIDGNRVSNNITYNTPFPGGGLNTGGSNNADYMSLTPGEHTVSLSVPKVGSGEDSIPVYTTTVNVQAKTYYTLHVADTTANTFSLLLTDLDNKPDSGISKFSFVNLIPGSAIDLYYGTTKVASNIGFKNSTDTFSLAAGASAQFAIRLAGAAPGTTPLATYPTTNSTYSIPNQRVYTAYARGYLGLVSPDTRRAQLSLLFNK